MRFAIQGQPRMRATVGYADSRAPAVSIDPEDVSTQDEMGVRGFRDGAMAGVMRSLRARKIVGNLVHPDGTVDADIFLIEPDFSGNFIATSEAASKAALDWATKGFYVIAPTLLAYDTPYPQYLWKSRDASPATNTDEFSVLISPGQAAAVRALAFSKDSGGGG